MLCRLFLLDFFITTLIKFIYSIGLWSFEEALTNYRIWSSYKNLIQNIYNQATMTITLDDHLKAHPIPINIGVQGDTISPKLFTLALDGIFKSINWENREVTIEGAYLSQLRFADDVLLPNKQ